MTNEERAIKNEKQRLWRLNNPDKVKEHKERHKEYLKAYYQANKDKICEQVKTNREKNIDTYKAKKREYQKRTKEATNKRIRERRKNDSLFRIKQDMRNMIIKSFKKFTETKSERTEQILGCTFEQFKQHIESKFENWMTWDNKGLYNGTANFGWDIDHITPLDTAQTIEDIINLNHYTNLQPLCSYINRDIKKNKV